MHQPMYRIKRDGKNVYLMPWVYLHGVREYYDVARVIDELDNVKIAINFVPALLEQIRDYAEGDFEDVFFNHFKKDADSLTEDEKLFILENFFSINYHSKLRHSKRYLYLLDKRGGPYDLGKKVNRFTTGEIRDLQVLFYLYNTSFYAFSEFPELMELKKKDVGFKESDKSVIIKAHKKILSRIIPLYKKLREEGKIEITFTPYAHPISPLLMDSSCAQVSNPYTHLPESGWSFPKNAEKQLLLGKEYIESVFGFEPLGMWPAEGGVSEKFIEIAVKHGVKWLATDEGILQKSLGYVLRDNGFPSEIYRIYDFKGAKMFFRDRELSDNLGFDLYRMETGAAVSTFMEKIRKIVLNGAEIISIILDGENPWENYEDGGVPFLKELFTGLEHSGMVEFVTGEDMLSQPARPLKRLHPGSWIRADFTTWIGHPEKNKAWDYLVKVKKDVMSEIKPKSDAEMALIYAEGSDWFWWYGDDNPTFYAGLFDDLFREHLRQVYKKLNRKWPGFIDIPIRTERVKNYIIEEESDFITPALDGKVTNFFEYLGAGVVDLQAGQGGVMQRGAMALTRLFYGRDEKNVYIRIEGVRSLADIEGIIGIEFYNSDGKKILEIQEGTYENCVKDKIFECSVPLDRVSEQNNVFLAVKLLKNGVVEERHPVFGFYKLKLISQSDIEKNWIV